MAANFSSAEDICEGENCQSITDVTYYVKEKKKLCNDCASTEGCIGKARKGHIIARSSPADHRVFIIDRQGAQREIPHSDVILNACIDPMTDDLYVVTSDDEYTTCVIDQVMSGGDIMKKRRVALFPVTSKLGTQIYREGHIRESRIMMTSSGNMIACDGDNILVFKNLLSL